MQFAESGDAVVTFSGATQSQCTVVYAWDQRISCFAMPHPPETTNVIVTQQSTGQSVVVGQFTFQDLVTALSPNVFGFNNGTI